jgi:chromosome segregation ATPase
MTAGTLLQDVLATHREDAEAAAEALGAADQRLDEAAREHDEVEAELAEASRKAANAATANAALQEQLDAATASRDGTAAQARERVGQLEAERAESEGLLATAQRALERTSQLLHSTAADGSGKLRSA